MTRHPCGTLMVATQDAIGRWRERCPKCHGVATPPRRPAPVPTDEPTTRSMPFVVESEE